jgi:hypothetical protein
MSNFEAIFPKLSSLEDGNSAEENQYLMIIEHCGQEISTLALYLRDRRFKSQPGYWLS